jgi:hypothetical protein
MREHFVGCSRAPATCVRWQVCGTHRAPAEGPCQALRRPGWIHLPHQPLSSKTRLQAIELFVLKSGFAWERLTYSDAPVASIQWHTPRASRGSGARVHSRARADILNQEFANIRWLWICHGWKQLIKKLKKLYYTFFIQNVFGVFLREMCTLENIRKWLYK